MKSGEILIKEFPMRLRLAACAICAVPLFAFGIVHAQDDKKPVPLQVPIRINPNLRLKIPPVPPKLWGFADLHAHPASHMSFGANENGEGGIFWGRPGLGLAGANPMADMPACATDSHYGFDGDAVRKETRRAVIKTLDGLYASPHGPQGGPTFRDWPHAQSLIHQQMHITAIRRAYDGGLRLMVASVTDAQMLSNLWSKIGANLFGNAVPPVDRNFDVMSARRQLDFIHKQAAANSSWMRIVGSAAEARQTIGENKLAVILSLEMDSLNADQVLDLVRNHKVRHVTPIHLANGPFGGTAIYSDVFNASSNYLNGSFFKVTTDPKLKYRLGIPQVLRPAELGSIKPAEISLPEFAKLGYTTGGDSGHKNTLGLNSGEFQRLMKAGLLLDLAHMSEKATEDALRLAEAHRYPVMNSHTGIRGADEHAHSERDMMRGHAQRLARLGGVIGFGTEGTSADRNLLDLDPRNKPLIRFTGSEHELSRSLSTAGAGTGKLIDRIRLYITTGGDDLRGGNDNANVVLTFRNGRRLEFANVNKSQAWGGGSKNLVFLPVPAGTRTGDIVSFSLITHFGGGLFGDNWNVDSLKLVATETEQDTVGQWITDYLGALDAIGGQPIALGTDMNGFAPQIPFSSSQPAYPLHVASQVGTPPAGYTPPSLPQMRLGSKTYNFRTDGLANYGMLPDFMQSMVGKPNYKKALDSLYSSADAVVKMWESVEAAAKKL